MSKIVNIYVDGYSHEITLGSISEEAYEYWEDNNDLEDYILGYLEDDVDIPEYADFKEDREWYDLDDIEKIAGVESEFPRLEIDIDGKSESHSYDNIEEIFDGYSITEETDEKYWDENGALDDGCYVTCNKLYKGGTSWNIELPDGHDFNVENLMFETYDTGNYSLIHSVKYYLDGDFDKEPIYGDFEDLGEIEKGFEVSVFRVE